MGNLGLTDIASTCFVNPLARRISRYVHSAVQCRGVKWARLGLEAPRSFSIPSSAAGGGFGISVSSAVIWASSARRLFGRAQLRRRFDAVEVPSAAELRRVLGRFAPAELGAWFSAVDTAFLRQYELTSCWALAGISYALTLTMPGAHGRAIRVARRGGIPTIQSMRI